MGHSGNEVAARDGSPRRQGGCARVAETRSASQGGKAAAQGLLKPGVPAREAKRLRKGGRNQECQPGRQGGCARVAETRSASQGGEAAAQGWPKPG
eukprot:358976-Chlamydomonas_euryale.AAC.1